MREVLKLALILTLICGVSAGTLEVVRDNLAAKIEMQNDLHVRGPALSALLQKPADQMLKNKIIFSLDDHQYPIFFSVTNDKISQLAIEDIGKGGYGGNIVLMLGIDLNSEKLLGVEIISHSETPGVGSQIEKSSFKKQWNNLSAVNPINLKSAGGQVDGISGATYSSSAMINGSNSILALFKDNKAEIMEKISQQQARSGELK
ncbi:MAG: FMN-binding protein [Calditrichaceae bacterium]